MSFGSNEPAPKAEGEMSSPGVRTVHLSDVYRVFLELLGRGWGLLLLWAAMAAGHHAVLRQLRLSFGEIGNFAGEQDHWVTAGVALVLFEVPVLLMLGVVTFLTFVIALTVRTALWPAMGDLILSGKPAAMRNAVSVSRWFIIIGTCVVLGCFAAGLGCCAPVLVLLLVPLLSAPYFAGRRRSVSAGLRLAFGSAMANPLLTAGLAIALIATWALPSHLALTGGTQLTEAMGLNVSEFTVAMVAGAIDVVGGFLTWTFAGAAFACMDPEFEASTPER